MNRFRTIALSATTLVVVAFGSESATATASPAPNDTVTLKALGEGTASTIDIYDPVAEPRKYDVPLPFSRSVPMLKSGELYQIVVLGKGDTRVGCDITVGDSVVASQPVGGSGQCIFVAP